MNNFLVILLATLPFLVAAGKVCDTSNDCLKDECCVKSVWMNYCEPKFLEGGICHMDPVEVVNRPGLYLFACPCLDGLECKGDEVITKEDGTEIHRNVKCRAKEF